MNGMKWYDESSSSFNQVELNSLRIQFRHVRYGPSLEFTDFTGEDIVNS